MPSFSGVLVLSSFTGTAMAQQPSCRGWWSTTCELADSDTCVTTGNSDSSAAHCTVSIIGCVSMTVTDFDTAPEDVLIVEGMNYSGDVGPADGSTTGLIQWFAENRIPANGGNVSSWKLCFDQPAGPTDEVCDIQMGGSWFSDCAPVNDTDKQCIQSDHTCTTRINGCVDMSVEHFDLAMIEDWQCHGYREGQDDDWCASAGVQGGYEFEFFGASSPCGPCWCCKRQVETENGTLVVDGLLYGSGSEVSLEPPSGPTRGIISWSTSGRDDGRLAWEMCFDRPMRPPPEGRRCRARARNGTLTTRLAEAGLKTQSCGQTT